MPVALPFETERDVSFTRPDKRHKIRHGEITVAGKHVMAKAIASHLAVLDMQMDDIVGDIRPQAVESRTLGPGVMGVP